MLRAHLLKVLDVYCTFSLGLDCKACGDPPLVLDGVLIISSKGDSNDNIKIYLRINILIDDNTDTIKTPTP